MTHFSNLRIGHGVDVHAFTNGDHLILGGVTIPYHAGLQAHSDGDVVIHALVDALLGAAALGDIGQHFPDTAHRWKNCSSRIFLKESVRMLQEKNFSIINVDIIVLAEAPKLNPYREEIRTKLANDMTITLDQVNIKATTTEKLGFIGRQEGIAATAIVLIQKQTN
jgi:2-C-methyl-D-erythritol 2,4-cyclodiphosphate synthase